MRMNCEQEKIGAAFKIFTSSEIYFQKIFAQFAHFQVKV